MRLRLLGAVLGLAGPFRYLAGVAVDEKDVETMAVCRRSRNVLFETRRSRPGRRFEMEFKIASLNCGTHGGGFRESLYKDDCRMMLRSK